MKRNVKGILLIFFCILLLMPSTAFGGIGPSCWIDGGVPELRALSGSAVTVEQERLIFDFSQGDHLVSRTAASYSMKNRGTNQEVIQAALPMYASIWDQIDKTASVLIDGNPVEYQIYFGNSTEHASWRGKYSVFEKIDAAEIFSDVNNRPYRGELEKPGTVYLFHPEVQKEGYEFTIVFSADLKNSIILTDGFNGGRAYENGMVEISAYVPDQGTEDAAEPLWMFVLGGQPKDVQMTAVKNTEDQKRMEPCPITAVWRETVLADEIPGRIAAGLARRQNVNGKSLQELHVTEQQLVNLVLKDTEQMIRERAMPMPLPIFDAFSQDRMMILVFHLPFQGEEQKTVETQYQMSGTEGMLSSGKTVKEFVSLTSPEKLWAGFGTFQLNVTLPENYSVECNFELREGAAAGHYTAEFGRVPEGNFVLQLSEEKKEEALKEEREISWEIILVAAAAAVCAGIVPIFSVFRVKREE